MTHDVDMIVIVLLTMRGENTKSRDHEGVFVQTSNIHPQHCHMVRGQTVGQQVFLKLEYVTKCFI